MAALIGLAPDSGTLWEDLRVGELRTLLALACSDETELGEGLEWILHYAQINPQRRRIYQCIDAMVRLDDAALADACAEPLRQLYGEAAVAQAAALLDGSQRFFAIGAPGPDLRGCHMHQRLLEAYAKVYRVHLHQNP